jgi:hypothetical protein
MKTKPGLRSVLGSLSDRRGKSVERDQPPRLVIERIGPDPPAPVSTEKSILCPVPPSLRSSYIHGITPNSPQTLQNLPPEILDAILGYLDMRDLHTLRRTHPRFKSSAQALIYHDIEFCDFRPPTICKTSRTHAFFRMLEAQPGLQRHIRTIRLRCIVDPTRQEDIAEFLPRLLSELENVTTVTISLGRGLVGSRTLEEAILTMEKW